MENAFAGLPELERRITQALSTRDGSAARYVEAGEALREAKALLPHGRWLPWLREKFKLSGRTAARYMQAAELWRSADEQVRRAVSKLALRQIGKAFPARTRTSSRAARVIPGRIETDYACPCGCGYEWSGCNPKPDRHDGPLAALIAKLRHLTPDELDHVAAFIVSLREELRAEELASALL